MADALQRESRTDWNKLKVTPDSNTALQAGFAEVEINPQTFSARTYLLGCVDTVFGAVPAEYFSQHSLSIKEESTVRQPFVVSLANGWLGYLPHREAFNRIGGHESTWCLSSRMEP